MLTAMKKFNLKNSFLGLLAVFLGATSFAQNCAQFDYFYSDINYPGGVKQSDLYRVNLEDGAAILSPLTNGQDLGYGAHLAYNTENGLLYLVNDANGAIQTLDPITGLMSAAVMPESSIGSGVVQAAFNLDGKLVVGASSGVAYELDLSTDPYGVDVYDSEVIVSGGDMAFTNSLPISASKPDGFVYLNAGEGTPNTQLFGNVDGQVTGMAVFEDNESVIVSSRGNTDFLVYSVDFIAGVSETAAYTAQLEDGTPFVLENGDMASGCSQSSSSIDGCQDFRTYYIHDAQGGGNDILYGVELLNDGGTNLSEITELPGGSHLGVGENGLLYIVGHNSGVLTILDPITLSSDEVQIQEDGNNISGIPAVVVGDDGLVYIGANNDKVYSVDPATGDANYIDDADVNGGDLVFVDGALWLANRNQARFYEVGGAGQFDVAASEINGVSVLPDGNLLISNGNLGSLFEVYEPITGDATGETFNTGLTLFNGDLASRCFDNNLEACENFQVYLANSNEGALYRVSLDADNSAASLEFLEDGFGGFHIALNGETGEVYIVKGSGQVATFNPALGTTSAFNNIEMGGNNINSTYAAVYTEEGKLLVGSANQGKVYEVNPETGEASNPVDAPVNGGDLIQTQDGNIWLINRDENTFYDLDAQENFFDVSFDEMYGAAVLEDGLILVGDAGNQLKIVDPSAPGEGEQVYNMDISLTAGDLAAGCVEAGDDTPPNPFCTNETVFVDESDDIIRLTAMGWILDCDGNYGMRWRIRNGSGQAAQIFYNFAGAPAFQGPFNLENGEAVYFTSEMFDNNQVDRTMRLFVDGEQVQVKAHGGNTTDLGSCLPEGCPDADEGIQFQLEAELTAYPNPSNGVAVVQFAPTANGGTTVEVLNMNGRVVKALFNQEVQSGNTYRVDLNGLDLPNGIYFTRMINNGNVTIQKIMIAK